MATYLRFRGATYVPPENTGPTILTATTLGGTSMVNCMVYAIDGLFSYAQGTKLPKARIGYQWLRGVFEISGAINRGYVQTAADEGAVISLRKTYFDANGITTETIAFASSVVADTRTVYDVEASFGLKALKTTGSIDAGTSALNVAAGTGANFTSGDQIIIPVGSGGGSKARGTRGVGGAYPTLSFVDATARSAETSYASGTLSWVETDGSIWSFNGSTWSPTSTSDYYHAKAQPLALVATINSVVGDVLNLNKSAAVTVTNADVYFDNYPKLNGLAQINGSGTGNDVNWSKVWEFGIGDYAFSEKFQPNLLRDCWFKGQGEDNTRIFSPDGCVSMNVRLEQCQRHRFSDLHLQGNVKDEGFGLRRTTQVSPDRATSFSKGLENHLGTGNCYTNVRITDVWQHAIGSDSCSHTFAFNCHAYSTDGHQIYIQWMFLWADTQGGGTIDCKVTSPYMLGGFEMFRSDGVQHIRPQTTNAAFSCNTAGNFIYDAALATISANSQKNASFWPTGSPIMNINGNIGSTSGNGVDLMKLGGVVYNPILIQEGYANDNRQFYAASIAIAPDYKTDAGDPTVAIIGSYPANPSDGGYLELPDYLPPLNGAADTNGARHIACDGTAWVIGIRCKGLSKAGYYGGYNDQANNINFSSQTTAKGFVYDCVADLIRAGTVVNTISNADYDAAGAAYDAYVAAAA